MREKFLIDPMLAGKGSVPGFGGTINSHIANPLVDLPIPMDEIPDVDAVIVTHIHPDHWDDAAIKLVPKDMLIFCARREICRTNKGEGFNSVRTLGEKTIFDDITLIKTPGRHGGDAQVLGYEPIIMDKKDVYGAYKAAPGATIIASHMESVNHAMLSRKELREFINEKGMTQRVLVPEDGANPAFSNGIHVDVC